MKFIIKINFVIALIFSLTSVSNACNFVKENMGTSITSLGEQDMIEIYYYLQKMIMELNHCAC